MGRYSLSATDSIYRRLGGNRLPNLLTGRSPKHARAVFPSPAWSLIRASPLCLFRSFALSLFSTPLKRKLDASFACSPQQTAFFSFLFSFLRVAYSGRFNDIHDRLGFHPRSALNCDLSSILSRFSMRNFLSLFSSLFVPLLFFHEPPTDSPFFHSTFVISSFSVSLSLSLSLALTPAQFSLHCSSAFARSLYSFSNVSHRPVLRSRYLRLSLRALI